MLVDYNDIVNKKYGKIYVKSIDHIDKRNIPGRQITRVYYNCICDCGTEKVIIRNSIINRFAKGCGCVSKEKRLSLILENNTDKISKYLYNNLKASCKYINREFKLSFEEYKLLILKNCHYCKIPPIKLCNKAEVKKYGDFYYNGIDRMDNSIGYIFENCITCCYICNRGKSNMKYEDFLNYIKHIKEN